MVNIYQKINFLAYFLLISILLKAESDMRFIENKGQWGDNIAFSSQLSFGNIYFEKNNFTFLMYDFGEYAHQHHNGECTNNHDETLPKFKAHHFKIEFLNSNENVTFKQEVKSDYYYNYFLGNKPENWGSKAHLYKSITYKNIYDNTDLKVRGDGDNMKYEYYLKPFANPNLIKHKYLGVENLEVKNGNLIYQTSLSEIQELKPYAYQEINGRKKRIKCQYQLNEDSSVVSFHFPQGYDEALELVIDPILIFSSYTGSGRDNFGFTATYDDDGNLYGGGMVRDFFFIDQEYPISIGAFDSIFNGLVDIAISKFSTDGTTLLYSTFVGGIDSDIPNSMIVNSQNELVVLATTGSLDFPITLNAYQDTFSFGVPANYSGGYAVDFTLGSDIAVFKLSPDGSQINASTYIGGTNNDGINDDGILDFFYDGSDLVYNYGDVFRGEIIVDEADNVYVVSSTNSNDFPTTVGVIKDTIDGIQDAVSFKLNSDLSNLLWSTYYGGENLDAGYSQKVDFDGNVVFCGGTNSLDFPTTTGTLNENYSGGTADGFIVKLNGNDGSLMAATLLGTDDYDQAFMIDVDESNNVYVVGQSTGNYSINTSGYSNPGSSQFIHKLSPDLSTTIFSTLFGNGINEVNISPTAFQVDICERIYVSGWGGNVNRNNRNPDAGFTQNLPITADAIRDESQTNGSDFYIVVFEKDLNGVLYGTYFGGDASEHVDGGTSRFDKNAIVYQAVCAGCGGNSTFPTTPGVVSETNNSPNCNLAVWKMDIQLPTTQVSVNAFPTLTGCVPLTVNFDSELINVTTFEWNFGDGNTSNAQFPVHTYQDIGEYTVRLIGIDSNSCNVADTAFLTVTVEDDSLFANFSDAVNLNCELLTVEINGADNYPNTTYFWDMGDGTNYFTQNISHTYAGVGTYEINLIVEDSTSCQLIDSAFYTIDIPPWLDVQAFASDTFGCAPFEINFGSLANASSASFEWIFGDGNTSNNQNETHVFENAGAYEVLLVASDISSCNINDTAIILIEIVDDALVASFSDIETYFGCDSLQLEVFSNNPNADSYYWDFGNGNVSADSNGISNYGIGLYNGFYAVVDSSFNCGITDTIPLNYNVIESIETDVSASSTFGCEPFEVNFTQLTNSLNASYFWDFGNGETSTDANPTFIFETVGVYEVSLVTIDSNTCNFIDSGLITITVVNDSAIANIEVIHTLFGCDSLLVSLNATHNGGTHLWDMGNGDIIEGQNTAYTYTNYGEYTIFYQLTDSNQFCQMTDEAVDSVYFLNNVAFFEVSDTAGCIPLTVNYTNLSNADDYEWLVEGNTFNQENIGTYTFENEGIFTTTLIAYDSTACNFTDTFTIDIVANDDFVTALFELEILNNCDSLLQVSIENTSTNATLFEWNWGDGNFSNEIQPNMYEYFQPNEYTITLIAENPDACHPIDTFEQTIQMLPNSFADFTIDENCERLPLLIENNSSLPYNNVQWSFENNGTSNEWEPEIAYNQSGVYTVVLTHVDSSSCNIVSTDTQLVNVISYPIANFATDSNYYLYPDPVQFTNQSVFFDDFLWEFGDGTQNNLEENPLRQFEGIYEFTNCLSVSNEYCADTICKDIFIDFERLIGVPNAFSPNGDGVNDILFVEGIGITQLDFKIYNRWGEVVFETYDQNIGWDGIYRGVPQEKEVYTYLLNATFLDGESVKLAGNITLLR